MVPRNFNVLSVSRDTLNPSLNARVLKDRLESIEYYKFRFGSDIARWPHVMMHRMARHLYKYKVNYLVKGFAGYIVFSDVQHLRHMRTQAFLSVQQEQQLYENIMLHSAFFAGLCLFIWFRNFI